MQVIHKGGDKVSDFNIKLGVILDPDAKVQGQINDLIKQIEGKDDIKINIDTNNSQKKIGELLNDIKKLKICLKKKRLKKLHRLQWLLVL